VSRAAFAFLGVVALAVALLLTGSELGALQFGADFVRLDINGDSAPQAWTPSGCASHFDCVDESASDGDATHLVGPPGAPPRDETFTLTPGVFQPGDEIAEIRIFAIARMEAAGEQAAIRMSLLDGASTQICTAAIAINMVVYQTVHVRCQNLVITPAGIPDVTVRYSSGGTEGDSQFRMTTAWVEVYTGVPPTDNPDDDTRRGLPGVGFPLSPFFFGLSLAFFSMAASEGTAIVIRAIVAVVLFVVGVVFWTAVVGG
jgi:hypothetical protein